MVVNPGPATRLEDCTACTSFTTSEKRQRSGASGLMGGASRLPVPVGAVVDMHDQDHTARTVDLIDDAVVAPTCSMTTGQL